MYISFVEFRKLASEIIAKYTVSITNRKSKWGGRGIDAYFKPEVKKAIDKKYAPEGLEFHSYRSGSHHEETTSRNVLLNNLANGLGEYYKSRNTQFYSDKIKYFNEHKDYLLNHDYRGDIDDYLLAIFYPEKYEGKSDFKEHFYLSKDAAKKHWLSYNSYSAYRYNEVHGKPVFIWDEENFPKYALKPKMLDSVNEIFENNPVEKTIDQSKNTGFIKIGYRPEFLKSPILYGRERVLILANGEKHKAKYAIVELDNILASHNEYTFSDTENYPVNARGENINDRNYSGDINAQAKVIDIAQNFEPETQVSTSATAAGLPVITIDGVVVSGNNRTMSFKRMVNDYPENYKKYLKTLNQEISTFGIPENKGLSILVYKESIVDDRHRGETFRDNKYIKFTNPVLVRIDYDFPAYNTTEMNKYNKDTKKAERPIDRAIKLSSMLLDNEKAINVISDILLPYETLSDFYSNVTDVKRFKQALIDNNILTIQETPNYFTDVNTLTVNGKEFLLNLLAGMILDKDALISSEMEGVKRLKEKLVAALPAVIKNSKLPEGSLKNEINQAILLQQKMVAVGMNVADYIRSPKLFDTVENFSKKAYYINELLNGTKYAFKSALESYNKGIVNNQGPSMFGEKLTPDDIFEKTMVIKVDEDIVNIISNFGKKAQEQPMETYSYSEKDKARARAKAKLKLLQKPSIIMAQGGNIILPDNLTELQRSTINKIYSEWKEQMSEKNVQLASAKKARNKAYDQIQSRCGLFGDTASDPRQTDLFKTELVCNDITFNNSLKPYDLRIRQIEIDIENLTEKAKKQIHAAMHQTELTFREGGNAGCDNGCTVEGKTHDQGGEKFRIKETGKIVELEVDEAVIKGSAVKSNRKYMFEGKETKVSDILNKINTDHGGNPIYAGVQTEIMQQGGPIVMPVEYGINMQTSVIEEKSSITNEELQIYYKVKIQARQRVQLKLKKNITENDKPPFGQIYANYVPSEIADYFIKGSSTAHDYLRSRIENEPIAMQEMGWAIFLNRQNKVIGFSQLFKGGVSATVMDQKIIFSLALKMLASAIILAHNHPSGNLEPSPADISVTEKAKANGVLLEIQLLDHIILSGTRPEYYSLAENGKM